MKKIFSTLLCSLLLVAAFAQSGKIMSLVSAELAKRGLTESEVRTRLLQNGINVDAIAPSEYINYQSRVMEILDQMQAEKSNVTAGATGDPRFS